VDRGCGRSVEANETSAGGNTSVARGEPSGDAGVSSVPGCSERPAAPLGTWTRATAERRWPPRSAAAIDEAGVSTR
jgi:hypothetical protein